MKTYLRHHYGPILLWCLITTYAALFTYLGWQKLSAGLYNALDLAIFDSSLFTIVQSGWPANSIHPPHYFADHFSPFLYLLAPFYWLWPSAKLLILLQSLIIAACSWPLFLLTRQKSNDHQALVVAVSWLANPWIHWWTLYEFSLVPFFVLAALGLALAYESRKKSLFFSVLLVTLATREDSLLLLAPWILILFWRRQVHPGWWKLTVGIMLAWFIMVMALFSLFGGYKFSSLYQIDQLTFSWASVTLFIFIVLPYIAFIWTKKEYLLLLLPALAVIFLHPFGFSRVTSQSHYVAWILWPLALASTQLHFHKTSRLQIPITVFMLAIAIMSSYIWSPLRIWQKPTNTAVVEPLATDIALAASYSELSHYSSRPKLQLLPYAYWGRGQYNRSDYKLDPETETIIVNWNDMLMARWLWQANYNFNSFDPDLSQNLQTILKNFIPVAHHDNTTVLQKSDISHNLIRQSQTADDSVGFQKIEPVLYNNLPALRLELSLPNTRQSYQLHVKGETNYRRLELGYGLLQSSAAAQTVEHLLLLDAEELGSPLDLSVTLDSRPLFRLGRWNQAEALWPETEPLFTTSTRPYTNVMNPLWPPTAKTPLD